MSLWLKNKDDFRKRYYLNAPDRNSPEMDFGKAIAKLLEDSDPSVAHVPRLPVPEQAFVVEIDEVPVKGYIDTFDPETKQFFEYKTGHLDRSGNVPWDMVKVRKHPQLTLYSLAIEVKYGSVENVCKLIWLETQFKKKKHTFAGIELEGESRELELTGRMEVFERDIKKWERTRMRKLIRKVAEEISNDFQTYK